MAARELEGRTALVTGGSRGIGRATALHLAALGAGVIVNYREREEAAAGVVARIRREGGRGMAVRADVGDPQAVAAMVEHSSRELGPPDVLVNNAGILHQAGLSSYRETELDAMWRTNVKGVIHCTAAVVPGMKERDFGRIVNISSVGALGTAVEGTTFYSATKAAVLILTRRFAFELAGYGIRVNAVCPGFIATDMVAHDPGWEKAIVARTSLRRPGQAGDIAPVVGFLVSASSDFVNGQILTADGGRLDFLSHS